MPIDKAASARKFTMTFLTTLLSSIFILFCLPFCGSAAFVFMAIQLTWMIVGVAIIRSRVKTLYRAINVTESKILDQLQEQSGMRCVPDVYDFNPKALADEF
jgi:hypothetical protein